MTGSPASSETPAVHVSITDVSVVIIGRNEGSRLARCLTSVQAADWNGLTYELIYVDSKSTDGSADKAASIGATTLVLDDSSPCAAKARNIGWRHACGEFILFLDGDTELHPGFVRSALKTLEDGRLCAAWGHRRELHPEQTLYNRVLDLDWVYPVGRTLYFGGDVLVRRAALAQVDGFDPSLKAGEEPEMCARLRAAGWEIEHIDVPMTRHDLAISTLRAYWLRAYRSGIAYAEVAERMRLRGDVLWQKESHRDFQHGVLFMLAPFIFVMALWLRPWLAAVLLTLGFAYIARTASRCKWKAPGQTMLCWQYAVHVHFQKIPALLGQLKWRKAHQAKTEIGLVDYKDAKPQGGGSAVKSILVNMLLPMAWFRRVVLDRWMRLWSITRLQEGIGAKVHPSNVILGPVELHGTRNIQFGRNAMIYPGVYLETQGTGRIEIGDDVVLSRGVHIVAFDHIRLGAGTMVGEYASLRDANHRSSETSIRHSGHDASPIQTGHNVWIGRGASILKGVSLGDHCVVGANAVATHSIPERTRVGGVPAKPLHPTGNVPG
jgi:acetyltransferase-like isoleucine patch superfamily enzyme/glycosyltransferase involved in cell wall biosynthesis